jgi:hypothetical protein
MQIYTHVLYPELAPDSYENASTITVHHHIASPPGREVLQAYITQTVGRGCLMHRGIHRMSE